jgi:RNA polymerase sigma factor (sigma-70 family)
MSNPSQQSTRASQVVEHFFRHEAGRLHGTLMRLIGPQNLTLVEDVAQEALLRAMRSWSIGGIPENPSAWVTRVAMNIARDVLRHRQMSSGKEADVITHFELTLPPGPEPGAIGEEEIRDDSLRLMFVCCHPSVPAEAQVVLILKVLCGFSSSEIARAFLSTEAAIEKQLTRTKQRIRSAEIGFEIPQGPELSKRIDGVLGALYLLFNEGYKASGGDRLVREELCREAIRLTGLLAEHPAGRVSRCHALLALMLMTAARLPARTDEQGALLRLEDQDRSKWDRALIDRGLFYLGISAQGAELTEYHLQAAIAACHCIAPDYQATDWARILRYYDDLQRIKPSPLVALNRAVAVASLDGPDAGLEEIAAIPGRERLEGHYLLHAVIGELHWKRKDYAASATSFRRALQLSHVGPEQTYLAGMIERATSPLLVRE